MLSAKTVQISGAWGVSCDEVREREGEKRGKRWQRSSTCKTLREKRNKDKRLEGRERWKKEIGEERKNE